MDPLFIAALVAAALLGVALGVLAHKHSAAKRVGDADDLAKRIVAEARKEAQVVEMMFGFYIMNNIGIAFQTFASGLIFGLGSLFFLLYNGLVIGAIAGHLTRIGYSETFWSFVIGHGVIELSVICIAGGSGLMLGWAILHPGWLSRRDALARASGRAVRLVIGCVPLLVLAGLIEGFISPNEAIPWPVKWAVGLFSGVLLFSYLLFSGRRAVTASASPSTPDSD